MALGNKKRAERRAETLIESVKNYVAYTTGVNISVTVDDDRVTLTFLPSLPRFGDPYVPNARTRRDRQMELLEDSGLVIFDRESADDSFMNRSSFHIHAGANGGIAALTEKFNTMTQEKLSPEPAKPACSHCATVDASRAGTGRGR